MTVHKREDFGMTRDLTKVSTGTVLVDNFLATCYTSLILSIAGDFYAQTAKIHRRIYAYHRSRKRKADPV